MGMEMDPALENHVGNPHKYLVYDAGISLLDIYPGKKSCTCAPGNRCKNVNHYATYNSSKARKPLCISPKEKELMINPSHGTL